MNQLATQQERIPMDSVGVSNTGTGTKIAPQNLGEVVKFAEVMCRADIALPKHLRGNAGACMAVAMQALEWQMSPFAVASKSYAVNGAIAYEAQLIAAVVNTRSGIKGRLRYQFEGEGNSLTCTVTGMLDGEECVYTSPPMGSITTKNSPLWKSDPQQQLGYFAARSWARRHCPEVILGVYDRDEAEDFRGPEKAKDITPHVDPFSDEPISATQSLTSAHEQSSAVYHGGDAFDASTGELIDQSQSGAPHSPDADEPPSVSSAEPADVNPHSSAGSSIPDASDSDGGPASGDDPAGGAETTPSQPPAGSRDPETETLIRFARDVLPMAADTETSGVALKAIENEWVPKIKALSPDGQTKAASISKSMRAIFNGNTSVESAIDYYADVLGCTISDLGAIAND